MTSEVANKGNIEFTLTNSKMAKIIELVLVFLPALVGISLARTFIDDEPLMGQLVIWITNIVMLLAVWIGLRLRNQGWQHFGLSLRFTGFRSMLRPFLQSIAVFVAAVLAFVFGAIVMANITGVPESADLSSYQYLHNNLLMLILTLAGVYVVSSIGEEVLYRAFLMHRIAELGGGSDLAWKVSVLVSTVVFGLIHFDWGINGIIQTACMGLVFAVSYLLVKRNLWVTILAHGYMDTILIVQLYLGGPAPPA